MKQPKKHGTERRLPGLSPFVLALAFVFCTISGIGAISGDDLAGGSADQNQICDHIAPASSITINMTIDSATSYATFFVSWEKEASNLDLVLYSPKGLRIDPSVAANDPSIDYEAYSTYEYYFIQHPEYGNWTMEITSIEVADGGEDYCVLVDTEPAQDLHLLLSTNVTGALVTAEIRKPDNIIDLRADPLPVEVSTYNATINSIYSGHEIDFDDDGFYDYLTIDVGVDVLTPGGYTLMGWLFDVNDDTVGWSINHGDFDSGNHTVYLDFDGKTIYNHGVNGPYHISDLLLFGKNWTLVDNYPEVYTTSAYNYTDFVDPIVSKNETIISGVGVGEFRLTASLNRTMPVFSGRYSYDIVGINIPPRPNNITITASGVENLNVGLKKIQNSRTRIWMTQTISAVEGIATVQSPWVSPGEYHVRIFGDAAENASEVLLEFTYVKDIVADGSFNLSLVTCGLPAGKYSITAKALNSSSGFREISVRDLKLAT